jgi:hypothetical protein
MVFTISTKFSLQLFLQQEHISMNTVNYQQKITFQHNDQDMSNENIKIKWKVYENSIQSYSSIPPIRSRPHAQ